MAYVKKGEIQDGLKGAWVEFGTFTLDPASIAAAGKGTETVAITGVDTGDLVFVNGEDLAAMITVTGAKVTAADVVSVYINNMYDATTAVDGGEKTFSIMIVHLGALS